MGRILVVDDEPGIRDALEVLLEGRGHAVSAAGSLPEAARHLEEQPFDLVITDLRLESEAEGGLRVLERALQQEDAPEVIVMTAYGTRERAQQAVRMGAAFYLEKGPHLATDVEVLARQAVAKRALQAENEALRRELGSGRTDFVGRSEAIKEVLDLVGRVAGLRTTVLVTGESGTGKERIARSLHQGAPWASGPFIPVDCGALPESLIESELFGYVKGAFTGADDDKMGVFEAARGGTLFIDEVGELPLSLQPKLLRVLQERTVRKVGSTEHFSIEDVRLVAATNRDLEAEVAAGRFREDLYFRLNVVQLDLPPLRERPEDVVALVDHFLRKYARLHRRPIESVAPEALDCLTRYRFPGNVRQLENVVERGVALARTDVLRLDDLPASLREAAAVSPSSASVRQAEAEQFPPGGVELEALVERFERDWIDRALEASDGVKTRAAELLGLSFRQFRYKLSKYRRAAPKQLGQEP